MFYSKKFINNFGTAIKNIAIETNKTNEYLKESNELIALFSDNPSLIKVLSNRLVLKEERKVLLENIFKKEKDFTYWINSFKLLVDRESFNKVLPILKDARYKLNLVNDRVFGEVFSVVKLSPSQISNLEKKLSKRFNFKITLVNKIDLELVGGLLIKVKNEIIDTSIKGKLQNMKEKVI
ncbi:ATP synthase F1 subunit delta [Spiroplasma endosymbiont of Anurida maritima]|uniref:ATP synthase F1 subunit delta n=1 Tax=Spiroplasma endosymbiont of Anurida maritima TaxID=2967972 RepID=UPI0036D2CCE3